MPMAGLSATKRAILDAALELAAMHGISGTTMDDVAERAGVAKGSLYYNFSSKDRLFEVLLEEGVGSLSETLRRARGSLVGWPALEVLVGTLLDRIAANSALAKLMASEIFRTDRPWQQTLFTLRHEALAVFTAAITGSQGVEAEADDSYSAELMASSVFGAVLMSGLEWLVFEPERSRDEVAQAILASFSGALRPNFG